MTRKHLRKIIQQLPLMFCILKKWKGSHEAYISKHNSNREKQITLLMIPNEKGWDYLAVKNCLHF